MESFLKALATVWKACAKLPRWAVLLIFAALALAVAEAAQEEFLGTPAFWVAARWVPWPQMFAPAHSIATTYYASAPHGGEAAPLQVRGPCPVGSKVRIELSRSGDGWVALAGWNRKQGLYAIINSGFEALRAEKGLPYSFVVDMTSSAGEENFIVAGSNKPFDGAKVFAQVARQLAASSASPKGGGPEMNSISIEHIEFGGLGSCVS